MRLGEKISWSKGIEIIQSLFSYHCGIMLEINIKRYLKITCKFSSEMWHLPREIFDLAIEGLSKVRRPKNQMVIAEKKAQLRSQYQTEKLVSKIL